MQNEDEREPSSGPLFEADSFVMPNDDEDVEPADGPAEEPSAEPVYEDDEEDDLETGPQENDKEDYLEEGPQENDKEDDLDEPEEEVVAPTGTEPTGTTEVEDESPATNDTDTPTNGEETPDTPADENQDPRNFVPSLDFFDTEGNDDPVDPITSEDNATTEELPERTTPDEAGPTPPASEEDDEDTETE